jgi:signal transduction histidine kinase
MLQEFIELNQDEIIRRCRAKVAARSLPLPTKAEIDHGVPLFLYQLVAALRRGGDRLNPDIATSALQHGHDLLRQGFTVSQVVHDYGDICQSITELALEQHAPIATEDFRTLNRCLDDAIAGAVTTFQRESQESSAVETKDRNNERVGFLVHELRNLVNTATVAFEILQSGRVGVAGTTGAVLRRSLEGLRELIAHALEDVRIGQLMRRRNHILVSDLMGDVNDSATLAATAAGVTFTVAPVEQGVAIDGDRLVLAAVIQNLLQNAFKFTRPHSTVTVRAGGSADRVLIEIQDECGGLPGGDADAETLFRPFEQRGADRTGLGIGLAFCRWGVQAHNGRLYARNVDKGCVFTVDLPRSMPSDVPVNALVKEPTRN